MSSADWKEFFTPEGVPYYYNKKTKETSWDKPDALKTAADHDLGGDWVWCPHEIDAYIPAKAGPKLSDGSQRVQTEDGKNIDLPKTTKLFPLNRSSLKKNWDDLVQMDSIDEGMIIHNLRERFKKDIIYTNIGTILISVNPFKPLPLYTPTMIDKYYRKGIRTMPPHIFDIADAAYRTMVETKGNQSILISGESGAGKTEATKQVLSYLAEVAGSVDGIEQNILFANPILEAFGNAKTLRNNNSSRFGKWVEILFDKAGRICGARTSNYLLEKSRVIFQTKGERNYHIFVQICKGANESLRKKLQLDPPEKYRCLTKGECVVIDGLDDSAEFNEMTEAMDRLGIEGKEQALVFELVAGILHLGNVEFVANEGDRAEGSKIKDKKELEIAAKLFQVEVAVLEKAVNNRTMQVKGQDPMLIPLDPIKAADNRDALMKTVYGNLFDWLVRRLNKSMAPKGETSNLIGVLDIFGFEIFEKNSFEQLCINYANEKLQQHFNANTFSLEEALYQREQIKFTHVEFIDNQPCLDLIENRPEGILGMLDEEIKMPKGNDDTFLKKLHQTHTKKHERYIQPLK
eukprot:Opistho-2@21853